MYILHHNITEIIKDGCVYVYTGYKMKLHWLLFS